MKKGVVNLNEQALANHEDTSGGKMQSITRITKMVVDCVREILSEGANEVMRQASKAIKHRP